MTIRPGPVITSRSRSLRRHDRVCPVSPCLRVPSAPTMSPACCGSRIAGPAAPAAASCSAGPALSTATPLLSGPSCRPRLPPALPAARAFLRPFLPPAPSSGPSCRPRLSCPLALSPCAGMGPGDEHRLTRARLLAGRPYRFGHDPVVGREVADRVGAGGIAGELERLAAAAAEVKVAALAAPAWLSHPVRAAEALEKRGTLPYPRQRVLAHAGPGKGKGMRGRAGQHVAVGHHGELPPAPAAHARFGIPAVVVGDDVDHLHPPPQPLAGRAYRRLRAFQLRPARQQGRPVTLRPAVVLRVGELDPVGPEFGGQVQD